MYKQKKIRRCIFLKPHSELYLRFLITKYDNWSKKKFAGFPLSFPKSWNDKPYCVFPKSKKQKLPKYSEMYPRGNVWCDLCDSGQNLPLPPPLCAICPAWNRVKVSENLGATAVVPVAPVDMGMNSKKYRLNFRHHRL